MLMMWHIHRHARAWVLYNIMVQLLLLLLLHAIDVVHDHLLRVRLDLLLVHGLLRWVRRLL